MMKRLFFIFLIMAIPTIADAQAPMVERRPSMEYEFLKSYIDMRINETQRTIDLSRAAMDHRLSGMNEVREQLNRQSQTFVPRSEFNNFKSQIDEDIKGLTQSRDKLSGMATQTSMWVTLAVSFTGLLLALIALFLRHKKV